MALDMETEDGATPRVVKLEPKSRTTLQTKALNFRRLWKKRKQELDITQKTAAERLGMTQGAFSQYLNGHTEMNEKAVLKLAKFLNVRPEEIDSSFKDKLVPALTPSPVDAVEITFLTSDAKSSIKKKYLPEVFKGHDASTITWIEVDQDIDVLNNPAISSKEQRSIPKGSVLGCIDLDDIPYSYLSSAPRIYLEKSSKRKSYNISFSLSPPHHTAATLQILTVVSILFS